MLSDELAALLTLLLTRETDKTITSLTQFKAELAQIRQNGLAYAEEEISEGVSAIATPIKEPYGHRLAIAIPTPTVRYISKKQKLVELLRSYTNKNRGRARHSTFRFSVKSEMLGGLNPRRGQRQTCPHVNVGS